MAEPTAPDRPLTLEEKKAAARARSGRHSYSGEWARGQRSGQGRMEYPGGWSYEGEWKEDRRDGIGLLAGPDGYRYKGAFMADRPHGQGGSEPSQLPPCEFSLNLDAGRRWCNAAPKCVLSVGGAGLAEEVKGEGGSRYLGEFRAGKAHGKGAAFLASGTSMRGTFENGTLHGEAEVITWP